MVVMVAVLAVIRLLVSGRLGCGWWFIGSTHIVHGLGPFRASARPAICSGGSRCRRGDEELVRIIAYAWRFPWEATKGHAGVDNGQGPDVCWLGVVSRGVVDFGCEVRV